MSSDKEDNQFAFVEACDPEWFTKVQEMKVKLVKLKLEEKTQGRKSKAEWRHALDIYNLAVHGQTQIMIAESLGIPLRSLNRILSPDRDQQPISEYLYQLSGLIREGYNRGLKLRKKVLKEG